MIEWLAVLCWIGTVYAFTVPVWYFVFSKDKEEKIKKVKKYEMGV